MGSLLFGAALVGLALAPDPWIAMAILALIMPFGIIGGCSMVVPLLIMRWFRTLPARAMLIATLGYSLGGASLPLLAAYLIEAQGWRVSLFVLAGLSIILMFGASLVMRDHPGPDDVETRGDAHQAGASQIAKPASVGALLRSPLFWIVNVSGALIIGTGTAFTVSLPPYAKDQGLSLIEAASLISAMSAAGFAGKLLLAAFGDRFDKILILSGTYLSGALAVAIILVFGGFMAMMVGAILFGFIGGFTTPILNAVIADLFGRESFGTVTGLAQPIQSLSSMAAIRFAGEVYDRTGAYDILFATKIAVGLCAGILMLLIARRHRSAVQAS